MLLIITEFINLAKILVCSKSKEIQPRVSRTFHKKSPEKTNSQFCNTFNGPAKPDAER